MKYLPTPVKIVVACVGLVLLAGCTPTIKTTGQYVADHEGTDLGIWIDPYSPYPFTVEGNVAVFPPGGVFPDQTSGFAGLYYEGNGFSAGFLAGGGALPQSGTGTAVDVDVDGVADRLDMVFVNADASQFSITLPRTDGYADYRCWRGLPACQQVGGPPSCEFTALGSRRYDLHAEIPFRDEGDHMNPGFLSVQVADPVTPSYESVRVPGSFTSGSTVYTTTIVGTTQGTITLDVTDFGVPSTATRVEFLVVGDGGGSYGYWFDYVPCPTLP